MSKLRSGEEETGGAFSELLVQTTLSSWRKQAAYSASYTIK